MHLIKKTYILGALFVALVPLSALAETSASTATGLQKTTSTTNAVPIADVNIVAVVATTTNGVLSGSFLAKSTFGSQNGVVYGFVARSKATGTTLDVYKGEGTLTLPEGVAVSKNFSYMLPTYLPEPADVYLTLYTSAGVTLAVQKVTDVAKGTVTATCSYKSESITCTSPVDATLSLSANVGGPQGASALSKTFSLSANVARTIALGDLMKDLPSGMYVVSAAVMKGSATIGKTVVDYTKMGPVAKIMSVSTANQSVNGSNQVRATVYVAIMRQATSSVFTLAATSQNCGDVAAVPVQKAVTDLVFSTSCTSGQLTVNLLKDGKTVDSMTSSFALPPQGTGSASYSSYGKVALLILVILLVVWFVLRKRMAPQVAPVAIVMLIVFAGFLPSASAHAATYSVSSDAQFSYCVGGTGSTCNLTGDITTGGTVTMPDTAVAGGTYTVSIQQSNTNAGATANGLVCQDSSTDNTVCDVYDVRTTINAGGVTGNVFHTSSGFVSFTMPSSPQTITVSASQRPDAPYFFGCDPTLLGKCQFAISSSGASQSVPVSASTPTVNLYFSLLDHVKDMFSVFAASN